MDGMGRPVNGAAWPSSARADRRALMSARLGPPFAATHILRRRNMCGCCAGSTGKSLKDLARKGEFLANWKAA
jgi:hypothetical protein